MATPVPSESGPGHDAPSTPPRTASTEHIDVCHPTPELSALQASVDRLERSAEELSLGGSDIGDEIRKLHLEQEASTSRRSSLANDLNAAAIAATCRSRGASIGSYTNSIIDLNNQARWGGYSPAAFVGSPAMSMKSGSRSRAGTVQRAPSNGQPIRPEPVQEGRPLDSPVVTPGAFVRKASQTSIASVDLPSSMDVDLNMDTSRDPYDQDAVPDQSVFHGTPPPPTDVLPSSSIMHDNTFHEPEHHDISDLTQTSLQHHQHLRQGSADTSHQANTLFHDFDGVHFSPTREEFVAVDQDGNEIERIPMEQVIVEEHAQQQIREQAEQIRRQRTSQARSYSAFFPPPGENMTYYPAPVPRMLNLPKRLSQLPVQAQTSPVRRPQLAQPTGGDSRKSASWLPALNFQPEDDTVHDSPARARVGHHSRSASRSPERSADGRATLEQRRSMMSLRMLPPQLRASAFFDQPPVGHDVDIQHESAVATLDSILAASATAPVNVFTDHPLAGRMPANFYKTERTKKLSALEPQKKQMLSMHEQAAKLNNARRTGSGLPRVQSEIVLKAGRRGSVGSMLTSMLGGGGGGGDDDKKVQKRASRLSLSAIDDIKDAAAALSSDHENLDGRSFVDDPEDRIDNSAQPTARLLDEDGNPIDFPEDVYEDELADDEPMYSQPTTLLAELQLRKVQQKSRNRTAATAFPNGMHSTLLELDAVAQIEKQKRRAHKVALAWEAQPDHHVSDDEDADIPLAVLFNSKKGLPAALSKPNMTRTVGLMERRQLEDNEPLSSRRSRILGVDTRPGMTRNSTMAQTPSPAAEDDDIPLAERRRRVQQRNALSAALEDISGNRKSTFSEDVMSQFGELPKSASSAKSANDYAESENRAPSGSHVGSHDETLGQRRARLQREKETSLGAIRNENVTRPPMLRSSSSLANLLAANPIGQQNAQHKRKSSFNAGGLLSQAEREQAENKERLRERVVRTNGGTHHLNSLQGQAHRPGMGHQRSTSQTLKMPSMGVGPGLSPAQQAQAAQQVVQMQILQQQQAWQAHVQAQAQQTQMYPHSQSQSQLVNPLAYRNFMAPQQQTQQMYMGQQGLPMGQMGYPMAGYAGMGMVAQQQQQQYPHQGMISGAGQVSSGMMGMGAGMNIGMGMGMGMTGQYAPGPRYALMNASDMASADPAQRAMIDRWRSSVAQ